MSKKWDDIFKHLYFRRLIWAWSWLLFPDFLTCFTNAILLLYPVSAVDFLICLYLICNNSYLLKTSSSSDPGQRTHKPVILLLLLLFLLFLSPFYFPQSSMNMINSVFLLSSFDPMSAVVLFMIWQFNSITETRSLSAAGGVAGNTALVCMTV